MTHLDTKTDRTNILIVDDREENLLALEGWLDDFDLNIVRATSGNEALLRMLEQEFALVLLDVQMPGMDGFETAELMRGAERTRNVPIIFVTAISKEEKHIFKGYEAGAVDYLFKPLEPHILRSKVTVFTRLYQQNKALLKTIDELRTAKDKIEQLSVLDPLTGCFNRRYLNEQLVKEIKRSIRYERPISLVLIDIDHFKKINDTYGHQSGDDVLRVFTDIIQSNIRKSVDWVSRYGGEEFVLVLPETSLEGAAATAEKLRKAVSETLISSEDQQMKITASFGVAVLESSEASSQQAAEQMLNTADQRMYAAKKMGRNSVSAGK